MGGLAKEWVGMWGSPERGVVSIECIASEDVGVRMEHQGGCS